MLNIPSNTFHTDGLTDVFMEPLLDQSSSSFESTEFNFEFSDNNYRYVKYNSIIQLYRWTYEKFNSTISISQKVTKFIFCCWYTVDKGETKRAHDLNVK